MTGNGNDELRDIAESFKELVKWTKFANIGKVKEILVSELDEPRKILTYHLSNGKNSLRSIEARVGVKKDTINGWWKTWIGLGIAESVSARGGSRARKVFELSNFGISVPKIEKKGKKNSR